MKRGVPEPLKVLKLVAQYKEIKGKVTLHRLIYNLKEKGGVDLSYSFARYSFGPYSKELDEDLVLLKNLGLVTIDDNSESAVIRITEKGLKVVKSMSQLGKGIPI